MKKYTTLLSLLFVGAMLFAQHTTQNIRGIVLDKQTKHPLDGVSVSVADANILATTDDAGKFLLEKVPIGRVGVRCQYLGYEPYAMDGIILTSTREVYLEIELNPGAIGMKEVVIGSSKNAFEAVNPLSVVSTRSFTAEETDRVAAGINDPGRVALSFPGVKQGPDENENTIIVRGNSPVGILWRVEGIDIPNPNHFALIGSSVGGVNVFSAQLLARSDFSSGGMAAEYGNALSGAFDMHFRQGNIEKREHRVKIGLIGLDFATEGPFQKGKSSYLVNYRYSTLGLLNKMGFHPVGERVTNDFQDLSFNIKLNNKNTKIRTTLFGIGGLSLEEYDPVDDPAQRDPAVFNNRELQYKPAKMGATGATMTYLPNAKSYLRWVVALIGSDIRRQDDTLSETNVHYRYNTEQYTDRRLSTSLTYQTKLSEKALLKTGLIAHQIFFDFFKNNSPVKSRDDINTPQNAVSVAGNGNTQLLQQYAQVVWQMHPKLTVNAGYHFLYLNVNTTHAVDPRLSVQYTPAPNQKISLAWGIQSQTLPLMAYYFTDSTSAQVNRNLDLMRTQQLVLAYHLFTQNNMKISAEAYVQRIWNVPVVPETGNTYWMLNNTNGYPLERVTGDGKGQNYGVDLALEKMFSNSYFLLATLSLFESTFETYDGTVYPSNWSSGFSSSLTFGKEFTFRKGRVLQIGGRFLYSGGARYTPYDPVKSQAEGTYVALAGATNSLQVPNFYRLDTRIQYRYNARRLSGSISLDIQNALNHINATGVGYNATTNMTYIDYRGGSLIPVIAFQFDF